VRSKKIQILKNFVLKRKRECVREKRHPVKGIDTKMPPMLEPYKPHRTLGPIFWSTYLWKASIMVTPWSVSGYHQH
jgi:hypothetical protein